MKKTIEIRKGSMIGYFILAAVAEFVGSRLALTGPPRDWGGKTLNFFEYEALRIYYWLAFQSIVAGFLLISWIRLRERFSTFTLALAGCLAFVSEVGTSVLVLKNLSTEQYYYLGLMTLEEFIFQHFVGWFGTFLPGCILIFLCQKSQVFKNG